MSALAQQTPLPDAIAAPGQIAIHPLRGVGAGACKQAGVLLSVSYAANYVFLKNGV